MIDQAIDWRIRLRHDRAEDWEAFGLWLEADPAHARAYDLVASSEDGLAEAFATVPVAANDETPRRLFNFRLGGLGGAVAAALVAAVTLWPGSPDAHYVVTTRPGEQRTIALGGTQIAMNGDTQLRLDRGDPRSVELVAGEAGFVVTHDAAHPFVIDAGTARVTDVGTEFNVVRTGGDVRVAVAEGAVNVGSGARHVALTRGQTAHVAKADGDVAVGRIDPASIGGWRRGRLDYENAATSAVAADIARSTGLRLVTDSSVAERPFTGVIRIKPGRDKLLAEIASLLDVTVVPAGADRWKLTARDRASH